MGEVSEIDLEEEMNSLLEEVTSGTLTEVILEQASTLTLEDLREIGDRMPEASTMTLADLFSSYRKKVQG